MGLGEKVTLEQNPEERQGQALALWDGAQRPFISSARQSSRMGCPGTPWPRQSQGVCLRGRGYSTVACFYHGKSQMCRMSEIRGESPSRSCLALAQNLHPGNRAGCQHSCLGRGLWKPAKESLNYHPGVAGKFWAYPGALTPVLLQAGATLRSSGKRTSLRPRRP